MASTAPTTTDRRPVCVTGGSGFIASLIVKMLLEKGYDVYTTVRDISDKKKTAHLLSLPHAKEHLKLFQADLLQEGSFNESIRGCQHVIHTASPFFLSEQSREALVTPAVQGTLNVLRSCSRAQTVKRVVLTSSVASVLISSGSLREDHVYTEADWSDEEFMEKNGMWYFLSKTLAERAAWNYIKDEKTSFDLVTICPPYVLGPLLQPSLNESSLVVHNYLTGVNKKIAKERKLVVDIRDVADAHIAAMENPSANGRYLLIGDFPDDEEICNAIKEIFPNAPVPTEFADGNVPPRRNFDVSRAKKELNINFRSVNEMVRASCQTLVQSGISKIEASTIP